MHNRGEFLKRIFRFLRRQDFFSLLRILKALLRGCGYAVYFRLFRTAVTIELPFLAYEKVRIAGPGRVHIGRFCSVYPNVFRGLSITTWSPSATVTIGEGCDLGGLTIRCTRSVDIGDHCMAAYSLIQDGLFCHREGVRAAQPRGQFAERIVVGRNVWIGANSLILAGASIGEDSVLSVGGGCFKQKVSEFSLVFGHPAKRMLPIDRVLAMRGEV